MSSDKMLGRISGLLRQAEGTDNEHEAAAFLAAAQRLATQASIDLAVARAHSAQRERRTTPIQRVIQIGEPGRKGLRTYVALFVNIAHANDVRCDVASNSTAIYAFGFPSDLDTCQTLYSSVAVQMIRASDAYLKSESVPRNVAPITARLSFHTAYARRIGARLSEAKRTAEVAAVAVASSTALALRNKEVEVVDYYRSTSAARGRWRNGSANAAFSHAAARAGDSAAARARLSEQTGLPGGRKQLRT